jgi:hypothetical protein
MRLVRVYLKVIPLSSTGSIMNIFRSTAGKYWLYGALLVICSCTACFSTLVTLDDLHLRKANTYDDSAAYLVDFTTILGSDWEYYPYIPADLDDWDPYEAGGSEGITGNVNSEYIVIRQIVRAYFEKENSANAFNDFVSLQSQGWKWDFKTIDNLASDRYMFACESSSHEISNIECMGFFSYGRYLDEIHIYPVRDFQKYLSEDQIISIIHAMDKKFHVEGR